MFLGRTKELAELNRLYEADCFQFFVLYGRRRIGKTTLLKEFCQDKATIFFSAELSNDKLNLEKFSVQVFAHYQDTLSRPFAAWENAFTYIGEKQRDNRLVLVMDEFPYIAERNPAILSSLQHIIDHQLQNSKIFLILCGSYVGFMEREILGAKSPLFGRRTAQLQLKPFNYLDSSAFLSGFNLEEQCMFYGALGGVPLYLSRVNARKSFAANMADIILRPMSYLYEEPIFLLREEIQQPAIYNAIIEVIAKGAAKANEIATKTGEDVAKCLKYIQTLCRLGILYKETPLGEKESFRRTLYGIADNLFRFWYRYVAANKTLLENDAWEIVWQQKIVPDYSIHMGLVFEQICREFLIRQNISGKLPFVFTSLGRWWGSNRETKSQTEIDIVARERSDYLLGECKWRSAPIGIETFLDLQRKSVVFGKAPEQLWFALFSKSGFTDEVKNLAKKRENVLLFGLEDIMTAQ